MNFLHPQTFDCPGAALKRGKHVIALGFRQQSEGSKARDSVGCHAKTTLRVRKMKHHVAPSLVLRAPDPAIIVSPFAHEGVSDLYINMLLLQYVLGFN